MQSDETWFSDKQIEHRTVPLRPTYSRRRCRCAALLHARSRTSAPVSHWCCGTASQECKMIDSKIKPQPGEGGGINTINQNGTGSSGKRSYQAPGPFPTSQYLGFQ